MIANVPGFEISFTAHRDSQFKPYVSLNNTIIETISCKDIIIPIKKLKHFKKISKQNNKA